MRTGSLATLIIELHKNGDICGIILDSLKIVPVKIEGLAANFGYSSPLKLEDAELIPGAGKSNQDTSHPSKHLEAPD